jgi:hypothetical protein
MATTWFISRDGKQHGPITELEFRKLIELGHLKTTDFVWHEGAPEWMPATRFLERPLEAARPEPVRAEGPARRASSSPLSKAQSGRPTRRRLLPIVASVVLAAFLTVIGKLAIDKVYEGFFRPKGDRATIEQQLLADPKMKWLLTLRDRQPTTYSEFMEALTARVQRRESLEDSINFLRKTYVEPIFTASAAHLDDEAMTRYVLLVVEQMEVFSQKNPKLCVRMLRGEPLGDVRPYLTESLIAQELQLLEDALRADTTKMMPRYNQVEQDNLMQAAVLKVAQQHGDLVKLIDPATPAAGREQDVCTVGTALFRQIAALPAPSSAALMRTLLSPSK